MNCPVEYRILSLDDIGDTIRALIAGCPDVPYFAKLQPELLVEKWKDLMAGGIARQYGAFIDGKPVGIMLGMVVDDIASLSKQAYECVWQVIPEYRRTGAGPALMSMFESEARKQGCARVLFGAATDGHYDAMVRLYKKMGYRPVSMTMAKSL
jgi:GNAT superfamily N-acetyltransferase